MAFYRTQAEEHFGDSDFVTVSSPGAAGFEMGALSKRLLTVSITDAAAVVTVTMDDARRFVHGGFLGVVIVESGSLATADIEDYDGNTLATVSVGNAAKVMLIDNSTSAGTWAVRQTTVNTARAVL